MLCEKCGEKEATVYYTEVVNNKQKSMRLCSDCFNQIKPDHIGFMPAMNLQHFLGGFWNAMSGMQKPVDALAKEKSTPACPTCGTPESFFVQKGLFGCDDCYRHFAARLKPLIRRIHGSGTHTGKIPERTGAKARLVRQVDDLKTSLKQVVAQEQFEKAAELRDQIKELEHQLEGGA